MDSTLEAKPTGSHDPDMHTIPEGTREETDTVDGYRGDERTETEGYHHTTNKSMKSATGQCYILY